MAWTLREGCCLAVLPTLAGASIDAVVCDPPYPCIDREYGRWTEAEWFALMDSVVPECRRVLKPTGSAVFVLQPNSERVGRMRTWLWEFMTKWAKEWGVVQDAYWWNIKAMPEAHAIQGRLMRPSVKACVWLGPPDCWRDQNAVLWTECEDMKGRRASQRAMGKARHVSPSGQGKSPSIFTASEGRGGVTPYNLFPLAVDYSQRSPGAHGHGAGTPLALMRWWVRYICPSGGTALDPFAGSGTLGLACASEGRDCVMVEKEPAYCDIIRRRMADAEGPLFAQREGGGDDRG